MNYLNKEVRTYTATNITHWPAVVFLLLLSLPAAAQDHYLQAQTITFGEEVSYTTANTIYAIPAAPFIVEKGRYAILRAGKRIELHEGFKVLDGGRLSATIESTDTAPPDDGGNETVSVFPNPTDGVINVISPRIVDGARLTDMNGFMMLEQTDINSSEFSMDLSAAKPGLYILEIISGKVVEQVRVEKN